MFKLSKILLISFLFSALFIISASAANIGAGIVSASSLNFRAEPSTDADILAAVDSGTYVVIAEVIDDEWYQVLYQGVRGYMHSDFVDPLDALDFDIGKGEIVGDGVRLRDEPSFDADTVTYLYLGDNIVATGVSTEWYKLDADGYSGYVHSDYVSIFDHLDTQDYVTTKSTSTAAGSSAANSLVDFAMSFLGTTYIYGGMSPGGFDCSGFTYYVFNQNGYKITRTASSQWGDGFFVERDEIQTGDLVFFSSDDSYDIEHVGMYIGNGQFIHSSSGGGCVKINNMSDYYYKNNYYGARRVIS